MDQLHADACDKLFTEVDHLDRIIGDGVDEKNVELALSVAKRVRSSSTVLVRLLAVFRDNQLQPERHKQ